ncbi:hypothetical protein DICSQDRAFT_153413 [Dichomitus squalens LYAD-421 SS1]|uniref:uncharacterized protein n=1 Tax=Dichomitus squalens (strain LYAD-421) TaxID=732165 RepID=UPI00044157B4|nr:uncharacterized protein DICSQDRAFT_153413 [Dichomitus squalens LYAD-421 SS1]EJF64371.1 hypothetical protein DICSQDRAFT_153413 [Dichomitus squalens LYAD-421 SS1]
MTVRGRTNVRPHGAPPWSKPAATPPKGAETGNPTKRGSSLRGSSPPPPQPSPEATSCRCLRRPRERARTQRPTLLASALPLHAAPVPVPVPVHTHAPPLALALVPLAVAHRPVVPQPFPAHARRRPAARARYAEPRAVQRGHGRGQREVVRAGRGEEVEPARSVLRGPLGRGCWCVRAVTCDEGRTSKAGR